MKKAITALLVGFFVAASVVALILFNFDRRAFTAQTYQRVFASQGFYERIPAILAQAVTSSPINPKDLPLVMQGMNAQAWEEFFRVLLPQDLITELGNQVLDSVFGYVNMESDVALISLLPLKETMAGPAGVRAVYRLLERQPACTLTQAAQMTINLITIRDIQLCNPPPEMHNLLTPVIQAQMEVIAISLPEESVLIEKKTQPDSEDPRIGLRDLRLLMRISPILPFGILILYTLLTVNSFRSWLEAWGLPFLITGVLGVFTGLAGASLLGGMIRRNIAKNAPTYLPEAFTEYSGDLANAMVNAFTRPLIWQGFFLTVFGLTLVVTAYFVRKRQAMIHPSEQETIID
ncbi:MAG: hypothetical protein FJZ87_12950 [Chloroflexi bacterium]|nr:hypothetical protein [Chloroflexota bacterium]